MIGGLIVRSLHPAACVVVVAGDSLLATTIYVNIIKNFQLVTSLACAMIRSVAVALILSRYGMQWIIA